MTHPIPVGTKVLTQPGWRVGVVREAPPEAGGRYRVRFADGAEALFSREQLAIFKHADAETPVLTVPPEDLQRFVIYRCVVGSTGFGLATEASDVDRRGFYLPPADLHWSLAGVPEQLETDREECFWEIEKFLRLALKANPNVLECLWSPLVETCTPLAAELIAMRGSFLSKRIHLTYSAYVLSQFKRMEDLRNGGKLRWKHAMHLIRLLLSGAEILREGEVTIRVERHRERLLAIRRGEVPWQEVEQWRAALHAELDRALAGTTLPLQPDFERANAFLLRARRLACSAGYAA